MAPVPQMGAPMQACPVVWMQVPGGAGFCPVDPMDHTKTAGFYSVGMMEQQKAAPWQGAIQGAMQGAMPGVMQGAMQGTMQGVQGLYLTVPPGTSAPSDASSGVWAHSDAESTHSGPHAAAVPAEMVSEQRCSRSMLRRERRKRAAKMATSGLEKPLVFKVTKPVNPDCHSVPVPASAPRDAKDSEEFSARMTAALEAGGKAAEEAIASMKGRVLELSLSSQPECRIVQLALQVAKGRDAVDLVTELHGHVRDAINSSFANFVIQKIIEVMPASQACFIADELRGTGVMTARHSYGCRILCRLFEQCPTAEGPAALATEILAEAGRLSWHSYGHHVIETILEHGSPEQRHQIVAALRGGDGSDADFSGSRLLRSARNRSASHVVEKSLTYCSTDDRQLIVAELLGSAESVMALAQSHFGVHVAKALLKLPGADGAKSWILENASAFQATKHGRRLLEELGAEASWGAISPSQI